MRIKTQKIDINNDSKTKQRETFNINNEDIIIARAKKLMINIKKSELNGRLAKVQDFHFLPGLRKQLE